MITIHFNRLADHATFRGIRFRCSEAYFDVCRELTDRGWWDEPATFVDERGVACFTVKSIHACARRHRPNEADMAAKRARAEARRLERAA